MTVEQLKEEAKRLYGRATLRDRLAAISLANNEIVDDLIKEARRLIDEGKEDDANKVIDIAEKLLKNNKEYQNMVGEVLLSAG